MDIIRYNHLQSETNAAYYEASSLLGLSDSALQILYTICNFGEACMLSDITHMTGLPKQTINSALRKLEDEGILYLQSAGKRRKSVHLTEAGNTLAAGTARRLMALENEIFASWTQEEQETYLLLTQRYLTQFKEKLKELKE